MSINWIREVIDIYWGQNLQMTQTFLFVKLGGKSNVLESSLEIAEVLRGGGRRWW